MTDIGLIPVLPAFTGFMPQTAPSWVGRIISRPFWLRILSTLKKIDPIIIFRRFPSAKFHNSSSWGTFGCNESWFVFESNPMICINKNELYILAYHILIQRIHFFNKSESNYWPKYVN
jgi:hypothetical protein